jgi:hypothetical protein
MGRSGATVRPDADFVPVARWFRCHYVLRSYPLTSRYSRDRGCGTSQCMSLSQAAHAFLGSRFVKSPQDGRGP